MAFRKAVTIPAIYAVHGLVEGNRVLQLERDAQTREVLVSEPLGRARSYLVLEGFDAEKIAVATRSIPVPEGMDRLLVLSDSSEIPSEGSNWDLSTRSTRWTFPKALNVGTEPIDESTLRTASIVESWEDAFLYREERIEEDGTIRPGLRAPQIGALHAVLGHWRASSKPATVVMPTGTGKTETMLALLVAQRIPRLLVLVPSDALREQIGSKFVTLGWLKKFGVVGSKAQLPAHP